MNVGEPKKVQQGSKTHGRKQRQASRKLRPKQEGSNRQKPSKRATCQSSNNGYNRHFNGLLLLLTHPINDPTNGQARPRQTKKLIDQSETKHAVVNVLTITNKGKTNMHKN